MKAKRLSQDLAQLKRVPLKLGMMSTISPAEIVELIAALKKRHEGLELRLCDSNAKDLRDRLLAGELEAVIYAFPGEAIPALVFVPYFRGNTWIPIQMSIGSPRRLLSRSRSSIAKTYIQ